MIVYRVYRTHDQGEIHDVSPSSGEWGQHWFFATKAEAVAWAVDRKRELVAEYREAVARFEDDDYEVAPEKDWELFPIQVQRWRIASGKAALVAALDSSGNPGVLEALVWDSRGAGDWEDE